MSDPIVELKSGVVRGVIEKHEDGFNYYAFRGIPYAEPPLGELRFEEPIPIRKWSGIKDCKNYVERCLQYDLLTRTSHYNEDCLNLNVFTRSINKSKDNKPVIVIVFGSFGSACDMYFGPEYIIRKDIVFVTISCRVGILGYLNLEDSVAPGNQSLKDNVMALQWVQQNIRKFGGNADNVTLSGVGAGGVIAHLFALSPITKGLFHKVISQSGTAYSPWATLCSDTKSDAIKICSILGKELSDPKEIVQFLKSVDAKTLLNAQETLRKTMANVRATFAPGIDSKSTNPVVPFHPHFANQAIHLPYLVGHTSREGITYMIETPEYVFKKFDRDPERMFNLNMTSVLNRQNISAMQAKRLYFKGQAISMKSSDNYIDFLSDIICVEGVHTFIKNQAERSSAPTYLYQFDYETSESIVKATMKDPPRGPACLEDMHFLFKMRMRESFKLGHLKKGTQDYRIMEQMTEMWTNFARYGRPTIQKSDLIPVHWKPIADGTLLRYLNISEDITMQYCVNLDQKYLSARNIKV